MNCRTILRMSIALGLAPAFLASSEGDVNGQIQERGPIFAYLLDTRTTSPAALGPATVAEKSGWLLLAEEDTSHAFAGDAVLLNDKLAVVLRRAGVGVEVYTLGEAGPRLRATLRPASAGKQSASRLAALETLENNPGAVEVEAAYEGEDGTAFPLAYRVTTGQIQIQMTPHPGVDSVAVDAPSEYLVVPDYFGDDLVYGAGASGTEAGLPAENFFMHLSDNGECIITCVWETTGRNTRVRFGDSTAIAGSSMDCLPGKHLWAAFSEHAGGWQAVEALAASAASVYDVPQAFAAKWRFDFIASGWSITKGWPAAGGEPEAAPSWVPIPAQQPPVLIYPIDRTRETPLNLYVLVDVMRNTLGVGPCQYILDLEGLDAQTSPTPALVCEWTAKQLKKPPERRDLNALQARLDAMAGHVTQAEARIAGYVQSLEALRPLAAPRPEWAQILDSLAVAVAQLAPARQSPERVPELAAALAALASKADWEEEFGELSRELESIGAAQDRTLAKCRMALRQLKQKCLEDAATLAGTPAADLAQKIDSLLRVET